MSTADKVADEEWARRVRALSPEEKEKRVPHVEALLVDTEAISDGLETELYLLREQLTGQPIG